jgi:hypothetical protein
VSIASETKSHFAEHSPFNRCKLEALGEYGGMDGVVSASTGWGVFADARNAVWNTEGRDDDSG